jgi:hypothetical protein
MVHPSASAWRLIERGFSTPLYRVMERIIFDAWGPCPCQPGAYLASFVIIRAGYPRTRSVFFKRADSRKYTRHSAPTSREALSTWLIGPGLAAYIHHYGLELSERYAGPYVVSAPMVIPPQ